MTATKFHPAVESIAAMIKDAVISREVLKCALALAYTQGARDSLANALAPAATVAKPESKLGLHEYDCFCRSCGRRDGSRHVIGADAPAEGYFQTVCFNCSAGDAPRAA